MPPKTHGERLDRLERVVQVIAEDQLSLQKLVAILLVKLGADLSALPRSLRS